MQSCASIIQRLPQHVAERSRSNTQILDFPCAVSELVLNSIQAGSKSIQIVVNVSQLSVSVEDDGCGISATSMQLLGQRFCSSSSTGRGESLSSLAQVSELQVTTRAAGSFETYSKTVVCQQNGQVASGRITLCIIPRQRCGTTVSLTKFLHNQPVRLRQTKGHAAILEGVRIALHDLLLPHTTVELTLRQDGSSNPLLHVDKGRSLSQSLQQYFRQHADHLHSAGTQHRQGWQLSGAAVAPPATFSSREQQLLYVNNQQVSCALLTQLLKDWYLKSLRSLQASDKNSSGSRMSTRTPEPGYVLLLSCPIAAVNVVGRVAGRLEIESSSSMSELCAVLQEGLGAAWGSMPSVWKASARKGANNGPEARSGTAIAALGHASANGRGSKRRDSDQATQYQRQQGDKQQQQVVMPVHGLQMSSRSRSLAGMQATLNPAEDAALKLAGELVARSPEQNGASDVLNGDLADAFAADDDDHLDMLLAGTTHTAAAITAPYDAATASAPASKTASLWRHQMGSLDKQHHDYEIGSDRSKQSRAAAALAGMEHPELGNCEYDRCWLGSGNGGGLSRGTKPWTAAAIAVSSAGKNGGSARASGALQVTEAAGVHHGSGRGRSHRAALAAAYPARTAAVYLGLDAATTDANAAWLDDSSVHVANSVKPAWQKVEAAGRDHPAPADNLHNVAGWEIDFAGHSTVGHAQVKDDYSHTAGSAAEAAAGQVFNEVQADLDMLDVSPLPINSDWQLHQQQQQFDANMPLATASKHWLDSSPSPGSYCPATQQPREVLEDFKAGDKHNPTALSSLQETTTRQIREHRQRHASHLAAEAQVLDFADVLDFSISPLADVAGSGTQQHSMKALQQQLQLQSHLASVDDQGHNSNLLLDFEITPLGTAGRGHQQLRQPDSEQDMLRQLSEQFHGVLDGNGRYHQNGMPYNQYDVTCDTTHRPRVTPLTSRLDLQELEQHVGAGTENRLLSGHPEFSTGDDLLLNSISPLPAAWMSNGGGLEADFNYDGHQTQRRQPWVHQHDDSLNADIHRQNTHTQHQRSQQQQSLTADEDMLSLQSLRQPTAAAQQSGRHNAPTYSCGSNIEGSNMPGQQQQMQQDEGLSSPQLWQRSSWHESAKWAADKPLSPSLGCFMGELQTMMNDPVDLTCAAAAAGADGVGADIGNCRPVDREVNHAPLSGHVVVLGTVAAAAPAESEETVQQHGRQQVQSRPPCASPAVQDAQKAGRLKGSTTAALADAASVLLPSQQPPLLPIFQERLVHSAPPQAKRRRVLARSGCCLLGSIIRGSVSGIRSGSNGNGGCSNSGVVKRMMLDMDAAVAVDDPAVTRLGHHAQTDSPEVTTAACTGSACAGAAGTAADGTRRRRNTCPAAVEALDQQPLRQAADTGATVARQPSRQKQQTTAAGCKAPLTDVSNTGAVAQQKLPQSATQQQQQPESEGKRSGTANGLQQNKQLKQAKLPFVAIPGSKGGKPKTAAAAAGVATAPAVPWYKKKLQQQKEGASKPTTADIAAANAAAADGSKENELVRASKSVSPAAAAAAAAPQVAPAPKPSRPSAMKRTRSSASQHQMQPVIADVAADHKPTKRVRFACTQLGEGPSDPSVKIDTEQHQGDAMDTNAAAPAAAQAAGAKAAAGPAATDPPTSDNKHQASVTEASSSHAAMHSSQPAILSIEDLQQSSSNSSRRAVQRTCPLVPDSVTRHQLQQAETLSQVANKVIVVRCGSVLLAVDQHAADERIQLESLQQQVTQQQQQQQATSAVNSTGSTANKASLPNTQQMLLQLQPLHPAQQMQLSMAEVRAVAMYQQQIEHWGWKYQLNGSIGAGQDSAGTNRGLATGPMGNDSNAAAISNTIDTAAALQQVPLVAGVQLGALDLKLYLHQLLETAGSLSQPPPGVVRTLKSKACRSAIMFGDELTQQQAVQLVQKIGRTQLCFCCAHGRPTTAPLLDLSALHGRMKQQASAKSLAMQAAAAASGQVGKATEQQQKMQRLVAELRRRVGKA